MDQQQSPVQGMVPSLQMCKITLLSNITKQGPSRVNKHHFRSLNIPPSTDLCVHAKVAIGGVNLLPEVGLYNGARGELVDFNYGTRMAGPNNKHEDHLPAHTVFNIPHLKLPSYIEPWDKLHPTVSKKQRCNCVTQEHP